MEEAKRKIIFWGTPLFAVPSLKALIDEGVVSAAVTQPDKPQGRGRATVIPSPVKELVVARGLPVIQPEHFDSEFHDALRAYGSATFLIVAYGRLIPNEVLGWSQRPAINLHPSLLPDLRGPSPIQTALLKGYTQTGLTLMQLDADMDHGPILAQKKVAIAPNDTFVSLSEKLSFMSAQFLVKHISRYLAGECEAHVQDHARATYSKIIKASNGELDLSQGADVLLRKIRALNPWPGTWVMVKGKRLKILSASFSSEAPSKRYTKTSTGTLRVRCGTGSLEVARVQLEGKSPMSALEFLNGHAALLEGAV